MLLLTYPNPEELAERLHTDSLMRAADRMLEWLDGGPICPVDIPKN